MTEGLPGREGSWHLLGGAEDGGGEAGDYKRRVGKTVDFYG